MYAVSTPKGCEQGFQWPKRLSQNERILRLIINKRERRLAKAKMTRRRFEYISDESRLSRITLLRENGLYWPRISKRGESKLRCEEKMKYKRRCENARADCVRENVENNHDDSELILLVLVSYCEQ